MCGNLHATPVASLTRRRLLYSFPQIVPPSAQNSRSHTLERCQVQKNTLVPFFFFLNLFTGFDPPDGALRQNPDVMFVAMAAKLAVLISRGKVFYNWNCKTGLKLVLHVWTGGDR